MKLLIFFIAVAGVLIASAQRPENKSYSWEATPQFVQSDSVEAKHDAVYLKTKIIYDFYFEKESGDLAELFVFHRAYKICTQNITEDLNTIKVSTSDFNNMLDLKVRVIAPDGKITDVDTSEFLTLNDEVNNGDYKALALPNVSRGGIVEFYYVLESSPTYFISRSFQYGIPSFDVSFKVYSPINLGFISKSYNGFPELEEKTDSTEEYRVMSAHTDYIPAFQKQGYSYSSPHEQRVLMSIGYNFARSKARLFTHAEFCGNLYERLFVLEKKEQKALSKIVKKAKSKDPDKLIAAREIENYLKATYFNELNIGTVTETLDFIESTRFGSDIGIVKLYMNIYKTLGYKCNLLLTCTRDYMYFDKSFNTYNQLNDYVLYFPEFDLYMSPLHFTSRLGFPDNLVYEQDALFIKETTILGETSFVPDYTTIKKPDYKSSADSVYQILTINPDCKTASLKCHRSLTGHKASYIQGIYSYMDDEEREELLKEYFDYGHVYFNPDSAIIADTSKKVAGIKPFTIDANLNGSNLLSQADDHLIVLAGELIGPQAELYDSVQRTLPIDHGYGCQYIRTLEIVIPEGYTVENAADFDINLKLNSKTGEQTAWFISKQRLEGNTFIIDIDESYTEIKYDLADYEQFRNIVNAAANFNKIKLVLKKS